MEKKAGIFGFGKIGKCLYEMLLEREWHVKFIATGKYIFKDDFFQPRDNIENWQNYCLGIGTAFLAIPTLENGQTALGYITTLVSNGISVVTCEKGALGNFFPEIRPMLSKIGYDATVGGGSGIIRYLQHRFSSNSQEIHVILNGTLNYIFNALAMGQSLEKVAREVKDLGYADPGANDLLNIIMAEACSDATKKAVILFNLCFSPTVFIRAKDILTTLTDKKIKLAVSEAKIRRFVVSFYREEDFKEDPRDIVVFCHHAGKWVIKGAFVNIHRSYYISKLCRITSHFNDVESWVNNGILILEGDDIVYYIAGPGAGPKPTCKAMIQNANNF